MSERAVASLLAICVATACGGSSTTREEAIGALLTATAAVTAEVIRESRRDRLEDGWSSPPPLATGLSWELPPPPPREGPMPLPLWSVEYAVDVMAEDLWCYEDADCERVEAIDCCPCGRGGTAVAVNRQAAARLRPELADECDPDDCVPPSEHDGSCAALVACVAELCRLLPVPQPPDPGAGPPP